jgi:PAS domain S-box-containing protein
MSPQSADAVRRQDETNRAKKGRRFSDALVASMLEHLPNMVFVKDAEDLRFVHFNEAGEKLLGYSRSELLGKNDYDFFPKEEADFFTAKDREVLASGRLLEIPEEPLQTRYSGVRVLHTKKIPICDSTGRPQYLLGISEDITERKEAERILYDTNAELERRVVERTAQLMEANRMLQEEIAERHAVTERLQDLSVRMIRAQEEERSRIAREVHDDYSQQLAIISIELDRLRQRELGQAGEFGSFCEDLFQKVRQLSGDLHGLSHELHPSKLDHLGLMSAVRSLCSETSRRHNLEVECAGQDVPKSLPQPVALCLYRIAQEALRNVVKHSGARQSKIEISGRPGAIWMRVRDSGKGFDPDLPAAKEGLGLVSMQERVRALGGQMSIESGRSEGTCITIQVPLPVASSAG